jgi:Na+/H+ antiporter NhaD/arsenite permease-like protein
VGGAALPGHRDGPGRPGRAGVFAWAAGWALRAAAGRGWLLFVHLLALYRARLPGTLRLTLPGPGAARRAGRPFFRLSLTLLLLAGAGFLVAGALRFPFWAVSLPAALLLGGVALGLLLRS